MSDLVTPWTAAHQAPPSMGFSRQEHWSGVPLPSPSDSLIHSLNTPSHVGFPGGAAVKNPPANVGDTGDVGLIPSLGKIPWRTKWQPTPIFLPGKSHGQRSLAYYSPWGCTRLSDRTHTHTHASFFVFYSVLSLSMLSITNIFPIFKKHIFLVLWLFLSSTSGLLFPLNFISSCFSSSSSFRIAYVTYYDFCEAAILLPCLVISPWMYELLCVCVCGGKTTFRPEALEDTRM